MAVLRRASKDAAPVQIVGLTAPKPVASTMMVSPGRAGCVAMPGREPSGAASDPSALIAMACPVPNCVLKIPGETAPTVARRTGVIPFALTLISALPPGTVHGTWKLICLGDT